MAAVVHSCVRRIPCDSEGELLCPRGAGAWQDLQGVGDGCQLYRLLSAQWETRLQDRSVHTLQLKLQQYNNCLINSILLALWSEFRLNSLRSMGTFLILQYLYFLWPGKNLFTDSLFSSGQLHRCQWLIQSAVLSCGIQPRCGGPQQNRLLKRVTPWSTAASMNWKERGSGRCLF